MSLIHYLTIGRFEFLEEEKDPNLLQRVLDHLTPGGLARLDRAVRVLAPFTEGEVTEIEKEIKNLFGLNLKLCQHLTEDGLLCIPYLGGGGFESYAEHVALIAYELFGAVASDRGHAYTAAQIKEMSQNLLPPGSERMRILQLEDSAERVQSIAVAMQRAPIDPKHIPVGFGLLAMQGASDAAIPELISMLQHSNKYIQEFAAIALGDFGKQAKEAIPALLEILGKSEKNSLLKLSNLFLS